MPKRRRRRGWRKAKQEIVAPPIPPEMLKTGITPFDPCIGCMKGDTSTALVLEGEAEWIIAAEHRIIGLSIEEATGALTDATGCEPGMVPDGRVLVMVTLCRECAAKSGAQVVDRRKAQELGEAFTYRQPEGSDDA